MAPKVWLVAKERLMPKALVGTKELAGTDWCRKNRLEHWLMPKAHT
jgi:hypothetical protein